MAINSGYLLWPRGWCLHPPRVSSSNWCLSCTFKRPSQIFQMDVVLIRPEGLMVMHSFPYLFCCKVSGLLFWGQYYVGAHVNEQGTQPQIEALAEVLKAGKANFYPEYVWIQVKTNQCPFWIEGVQCTQLPTVEWLVSSRDGATLWTQSWSRLLAG